MITNTKYRLYMDAGSSAFWPTDSSVVKDLTSFISAVSEQGRALQLPQEIVDERSRVGARINIFFQADPRGENLLDRQHVDAVAAVESAVTSLPSFRRVCLLSQRARLATAGVSDEVYARSPDGRCVPPHSITSYLRPSVVSGGSFGLNVSASANRSAISNGSSPYLAFDALGDLVNPIEHGFRHIFSLPCAAGMIDFSSTSTTSVTPATVAGTAATGQGGAAYTTGNMSRSSHALRTTLLLGLPLPGYQSINDRRPAQLNELRAFIREAHKAIKAIGDPVGMSVYVDGDGVRSVELVDALVGHDSFLLAAAMVVIFIITSLHTRSYFLGVVNLLNCCMSAVWTAFVWVIVLQISRVHALQSVGLILLPILSCSVFSLLHSLWYTSRIFKPSLFYPNYTNKNQFLTCRCNPEQEHPFARFRLYADISFCERHVSRNNPMCEYSNVLTLVCIASMCFAGSSPSWCAWSKLIKSSNQTDTPFVSPRKPVRVTALAELVEATGKTTGRIVVAGAQMRTGQTSTTR